MIIVWLADEKTSSHSVKTTTYRSYGGRPESANAPAAAGAAGAEGFVSPVDGPVNRGPRSRGSAAPSASRRR